MLQPPRTITILGSTGSIGTQTLDVISQSPEAYTLNFITCNTRVEDLARQVRTYRPRGVAIRDEKAARLFQALCPDFTGPVLVGEDGLCEAAASAENNVVMNAMVGFSGVIPTMAAIRAGHTIGLANKETLVSAGALITAAAKEYGAHLIAVDSEHSAILQCLAGERMEDVARLVITASGGPFRTLPKEQLDNVTAASALKHPNWTMGAKITIDSSTLMNKGFEVIEACWLFGIPIDRISVVVHPQSIIHSMVEFVDGSVKGQMGHPSMLVPIQYALTYPHRAPLSAPRMDWTQLTTLTFEPPDLDRFPCLQIAFDAFRAGGSAPCTVNAANEIAVAAFLAGNIRFTDIPRVLSSTLQHMEHVSRPSLADIVALDTEARRLASTLI